ncbi:MAG TPA: hypothetical protein VFG73_10975 [Rhodanobacteraceae bacterium]|nr:hypothetical protein [Rhodanobacteraceae bacterium]
MSTTASSERLTCAAGLRARRRNVLVGFVLALLVLGFAMWMFVRAHRASAEAGFELQQARQALVQAHHQQDLRKQQAALHQALGTLAAEAHARGLAPDQWSERRVSLRQQAIGRAAADDVLTSTGRGNGHLFAAESFDLSVTRADEGLFELPADANQPLRLTMSGTAFFSTRGAR